MKQIALILAFTVLLVIFLSCSGKETTPDMPEETTLEFWITQDVADADFSDYYEILGCIGATQYYGTGYLPALDEDGYIVDPVYYVIYTISAWPDYADGGHYITSIDFNDPKVTVYGLTVNSSYDEFERIFLLIRALEPEDAIPFIEMASDGSLNDVGFGKDCNAWMVNWILEAKKLTDTDNPTMEYLAYAIVLKEKNIVIGSVGCSYYDDLHETGITYFIGGKYRHNGYAEEAVKAYVSKKGEQHGVQNIR